MRHCEKCGKLLEDDEICSCNQEPEVITPNTQPIGNERRGIWKVIITAILYPAISIGVSLSIASNSLAMIFSILLNAVGAMCIYFGGFTLLVVPLPFIYFFRVGCIKRYLPLWKKILLGFGAFATIFGSIILAAAL